MIRSLVAKIFGKKPKSNKEENDKKITDNLKKKSEDLTNLLAQGSEKFIEEIEIISQKMTNLEETNFTLGRFHIKKGNITEAIFRFKLMRLFYPRNLDVYYELAYCYSLKAKFAKAQKTLEELLSNDPDYNQKANELLSYLKSLQENQQKLEK